MDDPIVRVSIVVTSTDILKMLSFGGRREVSSTGEVQILEACDDAIHTVMRKSIFFLF